MEELLAGLRAAAESTRIRLLALAAEGDLTVSEFVQILGQSQPRISRHLKLLCDAGLLERQREGSWILYRLVPAGRGEALSRILLDLLPKTDRRLALDRERFAQIRKNRADKAAAYFRANARRWHEIRSLHIDEAEVERALKDLLLPHRPRQFLDIGTGTGRMLELFGPFVERAEGVDLSREMLSVARANLDKAGLKNCAVRQADMTELPFEPGRFDAVTVHQVLHFAPDPQAAIAEASRVLAPGGRLALVDFAPHGLEYLRTEHEHRRLGFADAEIAGWCRQAGLDTYEIIHLPGQPLTVTLWLAAKLGRPPSAGENQ